MYYGLNGLACQKSRKTERSGREPPSQGSEIHKFPTVVCDTLAPKPLNPQSPSRAQHPAKRLPGPLADLPQFDSSRPHPQARLLRSFYGVQIESPTISQARSNKKTTLVPARARCVLQHFRPRPVRMGLRAKLRSRTNQIKVTPANNLITLT